MNKFLIAFFIVVILIAACNSHSFKVLQTEKFTVSRDTGHEGNAKILRGIISRTTLETDTAFKWFNDNMKYANPDVTAVEAFTKNKNKFQLLVFGGTWCHDTQNLLPLFYKLTDKSGINAGNIYLVGVDRPKTTIKNLHKQYNITNVPTFIVLQNNIEIGRVVEYGKTGSIDKELGQIVNAIQ